MDQNFDPVTGQPVYKFDPETGTPLNQQPAQNPDYAYDPATGAPVNPQGYSNYGYQADPNQGYAPNYYPQPQKTEKPGQGFAITGMVLGIASLVPFLWYFSIITGALGIVFGALAKKKGSTSGMATAGIVCGIIGVSLMVVIFLIGMSCVGAIANIATWQ